VKIVALQKVFEPGVIVVKICFQSPGAKIGVEQNQVNGWFNASIASVQPMLCQFIANGV
jgi:hypothetical protein